VKKKIFDLNVLLAHIKKKSSGTESRTVVELGTRGVWVHAHQPTTPPKKEREILYD
jgi:hypothetical protein